MAEWNALRMLTGTAASDIAFLFSYHRGLRLELKTCFASTKLYLGRYDLCSEHCRRRLRDVESSRRESLASSR